MSSSDETIFITQSTFQPVKYGMNICVSEMESGPNFQLKDPIFSDISDTELVSATQAAGDQYATSRFAESYGKKELDDYVKKGLSKNTESKSKWAVGLFSSWQAERCIKRAGVETGRTSVPRAQPCDLEHLSNEELNEALSFFVVEVRNISGQEYKPTTIYEIVIAIQHHLRQTGHLDDAICNGMRKVLDAKMKELSLRGIGIDRKTADITSEEQEEMLWTQNILGTDTPQKWLDTLMFQLGLNFALRAGQEHRNLRVGRLGQLAIQTDKGGNRCIEYREDVSKTITGGLKHRKIEAKITRAYMRTNSFPRDVQ